ncbi:MAG TPA: carboxypeptidase-like regulatory domain-containing protein [Bradyrhizobium sp.]|jgi:hypothetical protein|nr:carboxypeptidase-like regulatory domain-containing protein [Bradyrhizobium sp.]
MTMQWPMSSAERSLTFSPVGLRLIDDVTAQAPLGKTDCVLFVEDVPGQWRKTELRPVRSAGGFFIFPGLGRSREVAGQPPRHYRAMITAEFYRPFYATLDGGVEFDVFPYNDDQPPAQPPQLLSLVLVPAPNYPFPSHLRVLRGHVFDAAGDPVSNAEVSHNVNERVLTDKNGAYALPFRANTPNNIQFDILAEDHVNSEHGEIAVTLPADLGIQHDISIS